MRHLQWWIDLKSWQIDSLPLILVSVIQVDGSTPRECGASMLVRFNAQEKLQCSDTIGGGHLELKAIEIATQMLTSNNQDLIKTERFNLSARLGQCCGGVMTLLFEKIMPDSKSIATINALYDAWLHDYTIIRQVATRQVNTRQVVTRQATTDQSSLWLIDQNHQETTKLLDGFWTQTIQPYPVQILICGAGHVAEAIVRYLLPIGMKVKWLDPRDDIFPQDLLSQVECMTTDLMDVEIKNFNRKGAILILTHDHQLDLNLCMVALADVAHLDRFAYVGMIGSKSKRAVFTKRMQQRGFTTEQIDQLVCPIGISGISSKQPSIIAVAVVAELLRVFNHAMHSA